MTHTSRWITALIAFFLFSGCGPSKEDIMAHIQYLEVLRDKAQEVIEGQLAVIAKAELDILAEKDKNILAQRARKREIHQAARQIIDAMEDNAKRERLKEKVIQDIRAKIKQVNEDLEGLKQVYEKNVVKLKADSISARHRLQRARDDFQDAAYDMGAYLSSLRHECYEVNGRLKNYRQRGKVVIDSLANELRKLSTNSIPRFYTGMEKSFPIRNVDSLRSIHRGLVEADKVKISEEATQIGSLEKSLLPLLKDLEVSKGTLDSLNVLHTKYVEKLSAYMLDKEG